MAQVGLREIRPQRQGALIALQRLLRTIQVHEGVALTIHGTREVRNELQRAAITRERLSRSTQVPKRVAQAAMHMSLFGIALERPSDEFGAAVSVAPLQRDDAQYMQRLRMPRFCVDDLATQQLRRVHLSELHQPERLVDQGSSVHFGC